MSNNDRRKALKEAYKNRTMIGGVYCIRNTGNGRFYMDWDEDLDGTENSFRFAASSELPMGIFARPDLAAMTADRRAQGAEAFVFERLESMEKKPEQTREEFQADLRILLQLLAEQTDYTLSYRKKPD